MGCGGLRVRQQARADPGDQWFETWFQETGRPSLRLLYQTPSLPWCALQWPETNFHGRKWLRVPSALLAILSDFCGLRRWLMLLIQQQDKSTGGSATAGGAVSLDSTGTSKGCLSHRSRKHP
ncbi:UNVERIFIED_CONTAM: hypothetical protein FKN15_060046 [Acipenser sinensis]